MKLLLLIHRLPCPADRGAKLRAAAELDYLVRRHEVWCAGFVESATDPEGKEATQVSLDGWAKWCRGFFAVPLRSLAANVRAAASLLTGGTATEGYFHSPELERRVLDWDRQVGFDAVLAFSSSMAPLALRIKARRHVLDLVDVDSQKWLEASQTGRGLMRWVHAVEARRLERREREWLNRFDAAVVCSPRERELIVGEGLRQRVQVIETGAASGEPAATRALRGDAAEPCTECQASGDRARLPYKQKITDVTGGDRNASDLPAEPVVGFVGAMDYGPNIDAVCWFAEDIWPAIRRQRPDARFVIVGRSPARAVLNLAKDASIQVTGTVPAVEPYLRGMRVSVAPLRLARGVQTKVLAAMEQGRPCVVTGCTAEGIGAQDGRDLLVADGPEAFARCVLTLLNDDARAGRLGTAGAAFAASRYRPEEGLARLEELLRSTGGSMSEADVVSPTSVGEFQRACALAI